MWSEWKNKRNCFADNTQIKSRLIYGEPQEQGPFITIAIPTFNHPNLLEQAIQSALHQENYIDYNIIVVDNNPRGNHETDRLMQEYTTRSDKISYYRNEENLGMFGNWNRSIELCRSKWVCLLHDDDLLTPRYLEAVTKVLRQTDCGIVGTFHTIMLDTGNELVENEYCRSTNTNKRNISRLFRKHYFYTCLSDLGHSISISVTATIFNREHALESGGFDDRFYPFSDIVGHSKIVHFYGGIIIPDMLTIRRIGFNESCQPDVIIRGIQAHRNFFSELKKVLPKYQQKDADIPTILFARSMISAYNSSLNVYEVLCNAGFRSKCLKYPNSFLKLYLVLNWLKIWLRKNKLRSLAS